MDARSPGRRDIARNKLARDGPLRRALGVICLAALAGLLPSCLDQLELAPQQPVSCSTRRLNIASGLYAEAREQLRLHFKERNNRSLVVAYYISRDAEEISRGIRHCPDFDLASRERAVALINSNRVLRRVIQMNMRDPDPLVPMTLLGDKYDEVFKSDIH